MKGWNEARVADGLSYVYADVHGRLLESCPTYYVSAEMTSVAQLAAHQMPAEPLLPTDLPSPTGFCVWECPMVVKDVRGKDVVVVGFSWTSNYNKGVQIVLYSDPFDPRDDYSNSIGGKPEEIIKGGRFLPVGTGSWVFNDPPSNDPVEFMVPRAVWKLMGQTLCCVKHTQPERAVRRRLEREKSRDWARSLVRVVTLRREVTGETKAAADRPLEWTHRWLVSGHWRNQWCPGLKTHRLRWITPYVKGPVDKPLIVKATVKQLVR
jgi:hypothetical protein